MSDCQACGFIRDRVGCFGLFLRYAVWSLWDPHAASDSMAARSDNVRR